MRRGRLNWYRGRSMEVPASLTSAYDYELPRGLIAQQPAPRRDESRLMVLGRCSSRLKHRRFSDLPDYLNPGDVLVLNDSKVLPAKLLGTRETGGRAVALVLGYDENGRGQIMLQARGNLQPGEKIAFAEGKLQAKLLEREPGGVWRVDFGKQDVTPVLEEVGRAPLPPYIKRDVFDDPFVEGDRKRYQTVYARAPGSIAAPTAGLHFTRELLQKIAAKGVQVAYLTLHVGLGTFAPLRTERVEEHRMHAEHFTFTQECAAAVNQAKRADRRVIAVGTSAVRVLESVAGEAEAPDKLAPCSGQASLFIYPPFEFRIVDVLLTNFHLPRSSTLLLACAFAGRERILAAYEQAKLERYRFYSYGDAMLII